MKRMRGFLKNIMLLSAVLFLLYWAGSIVKCELLTLHHGEEFEDAWMENTMIACNDDLKVLEYNDIYAYVYYICDCPELGSGNTIFFLKDTSSGGWIFHRWDTIWSDSGNADGFIWPYIR